MSAHPPDPRSRRPTTPTGNRYALAGGNPVSYVEWDGHMIIDGAGAASTGGNCISPQPTASPSSATTSGSSGSSGSSGGGVDPIRSWMGFYHGFVAQAQEEGKGLVDLSKTLGCGVAHLCSSKAYQQEHAKAERLLNNPDQLSIREQLNMLWEGATASTRQDWTSGRKAQAAGRAIWIGLSTLAATKGVGKAGEAGAETTTAQAAEAGTVKNAFHYTTQQFARSIEQEGLRPGSCATPSGSLSPL